MRQKKGGKPKLSSKGFENLSGKHFFIYCRLILLNLMYFSLSLAIPSYETDNALTHIYIQHKKVSVH